ncbi:Ribosomal protein L41 [Spatholobus suberectus]|nr:Ribosomal protein L41 [Spatholobus suberectus]
MRAKWKKKRMRRLKRKRRKMRQRSNFALSNMKAWSSDSVDRGVIMWGKTSGEEALL